MKKNKSLIILLVAILTIMAIFPLGASAAIGDVTGSALKTDIVTYINNYPIPSFDINGNIAVVAEDLSAYGFLVLWNDDERTLTIQRNDTTEIYPIPTKKAAKSEVGKYFTDILETDIRVFVGENEVESFCMNGYISIYVDSIGSYGFVQWVDWMRALKVWIEDGLSMKETSDPVDEEVVYIPTVVAKPVAVSNPTPSNNGIYYWTPGGDSYHSTSGCRSLARSKVIKSGTLAQAKNAGKHDPCNNCVR